MGKKKDLKKVLAVGTQKLLQRAPVPAEMGKEKMQYQAVKYAMRMMVCRKHFMVHSQPAQNIIVTHCLASLFPRPRLSFEV